MDLVALALAKKYTDDTLAGSGSLQGKDGKSAYQIALDNGFIGTEVDWLESLKGEAGKDGQDYILTDSDKMEIAEIIKTDYDAELLEILGGDENVAE